MSRYSIPRPRPSDPRTNPSLSSTIGLIADAIDSLDNRVYYEENKPPIQGPQGIQGPTGPTGPTGATGPQGPPGPGLEVVGTVPNSGSLPSGLGPNDAGDAWMAQDTGHLWVWDGDSWTDLGPIAAGMTTEQGDARYVNLTGDTMTGGLFVASPLASDVLLSVKQANNVGMQFYPSGDGSVYIGTLDANAAFMWGNYIAFQRAGWNFHTPVGFSNGINGSVTFGPDLNSLVTFNSNVVHMAQGDYNVPWNVKAHYQGADIGQVSWMQLGNVLQLLPFIPPSGWVWNDRLQYDLSQPGSGWQFADPLKGPLYVKGPAGNPADVFGAQFAIRQSDDPSGPYVPLAIYYDSSTGTANTTFKAWRNAATYNFAAGVAGGVSFAVDGIFYVFNGTFRGHQLMGGGQAYHAQSVKAGRILGTEAQGSIELSAGTGATSGFTAYFNPDGTRAGYLGYVNTADNQFNFVAETITRFTFNKPITSPTNPVAKATTPVAADYGAATIPVGAIWVQTA